MTSAGLTIAEAAERTGLTRHTLRYYERDGLMLEVGRAGTRKWSGPATAMRTSGWRCCGPTASECAPSSRQ